MSDTFLISSNSPCNYCIYFEECYGVCGTDKECNDYRLFMGKEVIYNKD